MESEKLLAEAEFQKKSKIRLVILLPILAILLALTICFIVLYVQERNKTDGTDNKTDSPINGDKSDSSDNGKHDYHEYIPLPSWNDGTAKKSLSEFISKINSAEYYVPKEDE